LWASKGHHITFSPQQLVGFAVTLVKIFKFKILDRGHLKLQLYNMTLFCPNLVWNVDE
jgi:hypothetical protein